MLSVTVDRGFVTKALREQGVLDLHPAVLELIRTEFVFVIETDLKAGCCTSVGQCMSVALDTIQSFGSPGKHRRQTGVCPKPRTERPPVTYESAP